MIIKPVRGTDMFTLAIVIGASAILAAQQSLAAPATSHKPASSPAPAAGKQSSPMHSGFQATDLRPEVAKLLLPKAPSSVEVEDFSIQLDSPSIVADIPGSFIDTLQPSAINSIGQQTAAAVFMRVIASKAQSVDDALSNCYIGKETVTRAGSEFTIYKFRAKNGRTARIFVYFNDMSGVVGVVEMGAAKK
jgi:hypothetical protein